MAFDRIRFTANAWSTKGNSGTSWCKITDHSGRTVYERNGYVVGTWGTEEYSLPYAFNGDMARIYFGRHIDTRSHGNASMKVDIRDAYTEEWYTVINISSGYRTGKHWESHSWGVSSINSYQIPSDRVINVNLNNGYISKDIKFTATKWSEPSLCLYTNNGIFYGKLSKVKPNFNTLKIDNYYLVEKYPANSFSYNKRSYSHNVFRDSIETRECQRLEVNFRCSSRGAPSYSHNNSNREGVIYVDIFKKSGQKILSKKIVVWDYLGGGAKKEITYKNFFTKEFYEPVTVKVSWVFDVGYYVANINGSHSGVSVIEEFELLLKYN